MVNDVLEYLRLENVTIRPRIAESGSTCTKHAEGGRQTQRKLIYERRNHYLSALY